MRLRHRSMAAEVILRECGQRRRAAEIERCEREVEQDAAEIINEIRRRTQDSVHGMRAVLQSLAGIEGPKSVILISEGLIFEGLGSRDRRTRVDRRRLARHARHPAARRAAVRRVAVAAADHAARGSRPAGHRPRDARRRGARHRSIASTSPPISRSIASRGRSTAIYLLGVESRPEDRNGRRHRIAREERCAAA